jgi:hypothetical protein
MSNHIITKSKMTVDGYVDAVVQEVQIKLASLILNEAECNWCKERLHLYLANRCIRDPYAV